MKSQLGDHSVFFVFGLVLEKSLNIVTSWSTAVKVAVSILLGVMTVTTGSVGLYYGLVGELKQTETIITQHVEECKVMKIRMRDLENLIHRLLLNQIHSKDHSHE